MSKFKRQFTQEYNSIADRLYCKVNICETYDPESEKPKNTRCHTYNAIWDTGANKTVISPRIVKELHLKSTINVVFETVNSAHHADVYVVSLSIGNNVTIHGIQAAEADLDWTDALIGMDIITMGDLSVTNDNNKTVLNFVIPNKND